MTTTILPELARDTAESMRRALGRRSPGDFTTREIEGSVSLCLSVRSLIQQLGESVQEALNRGVEVNALRIEAVQTLVAIDAYLGVVADLRESTRDLATLSRTALEGLAELSGTEAEVLECRRVIAELLRWADTLPRPVDPGLLEEARAAGERGEQEPAEDILARLEAGGEL